MGSSKAPAPLKQNSVYRCEICNIRCPSRASRNFHYGELCHINRAKELTNSLFGYIPEKHITCLDDMFSDPNRKGYFIGLHYLKVVNQQEKPLSFFCILCNFLCSTIFEHLVSIKHKRKYICKHFSFLLRDPAGLSLNVLEKIAKVIEEVEGLQKFKMALKKPIEQKAYSDCSSKQIIDKIVAQLIVHGIDIKNPYGKGNNVLCLDTASNSSVITEKKLTINPSVASEPSAASESTPRQVNDKIVQKPQNHQIDFKDTSQKENALETGSCSSETNKKKPTINPSVPFEPSAASENTPRQVNDQCIEKQQNHQIDFKDTSQKENALETGSRASGTNEKKATINHSVASEPSAASENASRQVNDKKQQKHQIDFKDTSQKENALETGSRSSGTNTKKLTINRSAASEPSAASENTSRQVNDKIIEKQQKLQIDFKDTSQKENALQTGSRSSRAKEKNPSVPCEPSAISKNTARQVEKRRIHRIDFKDTSKKENALQTGSRSSRAKEKNPSVPCEPSAISKNTSRQVEKRGIHRIDFKHTYRKENALKTGSRFSSGKEKNLSVPSEPSAISKNTSRRVNNIIIEKRRIHRIDFKDTYRKENGLKTGSHSSSTKEKHLHVPSEPSAISKNTSRQVEKRRIHQIDFKDTYRKENCLKTGSRSSSTKEKNLNVPSEPSAISKNTSRHVNDKIIEKRQIHRIDFKDTCRKDNSLKTGSHVSARNGKRPSQFKPLPAFKRCKSELPGQCAGEPIVLSRPVPVPFSFSHASVGVPVGNKTHKHNSLQASMLPTTSYIPPLMNIKQFKSELPGQYAGEPIVSLSRPVPVPFSFSHVSNQTQKHNSSQASMLPSTSYIPPLMNIKVPKPRSSLCRLYQTPWPPAEEQFPSLPPGESFYHNAECRYGYNSDPSLYGFTNQSAYGQASLVSDVGQACDLAGQTWGQETGQPGAKHLHTLGTMGDSVSPPNRHSGQCSLEASPKQDTNSCSGYSSVDSKELSSKYPSPSRIISPKSLGDIHPPEDLPPTTSTSLCAKTLQSTNSSMPIKTASVLSPDTLKILQGRDPTSVKSILKRLAEYCPELQQVNICLLVDVLFETGALNC